MLTVCSLTRRNVHRKILLMGFANHFCRKGSQRPLSMLKRFPDGEGRTRQRGRGKHCFIFSNPTGNLQERRGGFRWRHGAVELASHPGKPRGLRDAQLWWPPTITVGSPRGQSHKMRETYRQITAVSPQSSEEAPDLGMAPL